MLEAAVEAVRAHGAGRRFSALTPSPGDFRRGGLTFLPLPCGSPGWRVMRLRRAARVGSQQLPSPGSSGPGGRRHQAEFGRGYGSRPSPGLDERETLACGVVLHGRRVIVFTPPRGSWR